MTMIAASPREHRPARATPADAAAAPAGEIKYRQDAANYVAAMLAELRQIAGKAGFDKLVKSIDAAYYDAYGALDGKVQEAAPAPAETAGEKTSNLMEPNGT